MRERSYTFFGLQIVSTFSLPELQPFEQKHSVSEPDVLIRLEPPAPPEPSQESSNQIIRPDLFFFSVPDVARYWVRAGKEIVIIPQHGTREREIRLFLLGSAWGALCYQRGYLPIHAGVVKVGDGAIALCCPSGGGKSTLLAWLVKRGYSMVADDLCRFELSNKAQALVWPGAPRLKLWQDALDAIGHPSGGLDRDYFRHNKFHLPWSANKQPQPVMLRAIFLLSQGELGLSRVTGMAALRQFIAAASYRGDLLEPMGILAVHWQRCAEMLRRVPVYILSRPRDWSSIEPTLDLITATCQ